MNGGGDPTLEVHQTAFHQTTPLFVIKNDARVGTLNGRGIGLRVHFASSAFDKDHGVPINLTF
jgi:hypothetical protein